MKKPNNVEKILKNIYYGFISCLFSIILTGSVLGVAGLYKLTFAIPLAIISGLLIYFVIFRPGKNRATNPQKLRPSPRSVLTDNYVYLITFVVIILMMLVPIIRWPESIAGNWFPWDAGKYHFPKAVEMAQSGSANDMTIAYSEYPFGYESLLAFCILLTGDTALFGWMHAVIDLFFILSFWLLARRITKINASTLLFLITFLILSNYIFQLFNLWQVFQPEVTTVGKNDLFLAASLLAVLYFYPYPRIEQEAGKNLLPAGIVGMIALSIKPNAVFLLAPLWIFLGIETLVDGLKNGFKPLNISVKPYIISSILMIPGVMWLIRNLIINKKIFSDYILEASKWSIAANLTNPYFFNYISKNLWLIIGLLLLMLYVSIRNYKYRWYTGILFLLILGFIFTPVTAFFLKTDVPATINWRFGEAMLVYVFIMILLLINDLIKKIGWIQKYFSHFVNLRVPLFFVAGCAMLWSQVPVLQKIPENQIILRDQFREAVGVNGYHSVYDFVQKNVRNSVVWVENGLPFYAYGPGFSNSVSRKTSADFIILIKTDWFGEGSMQIPRYFDPDSWQNYYDVVYEDPQGIVFALRK